MVDDYEVIERSWALVATEILVLGLVIFLILKFAHLVSQIRWSNRFSLRTLLIATTLFAVVLGIIVVLS